MTRCRARDDVRGVWVEEEGVSGGRVGGGSAARRRPFLGGPRPPRRTRRRLREMVRQVRRARPAGSVSGRAPGAGGRGRGPGLWVGAEEFNERAYSR